MNNKANAVTPLFSRMIMLGVLFVIIIFGFASVARMMKFVSDSELSIFERKLSDDIKMISATKASKEFSYNLPSEVSKIIVIDHAYRKALMENPFVKSERIIYDVIDSGERTNIFMFSSSGELIEKSYIGDIEIGMIGDQICTGIGVFENPSPKLTIRITKKPAAKALLGEECLQFTYEAFAPPFTDDIFPEGNQKLTISYDQKGIELALDRIKGDNTYFNSSMLNTTPFNISSSDNIDKFYYKVESINDAEIKFRIGFNKTTDNSIYFYGSNITASPDEPGYYYSYPGAEIKTPGFDFSNIIIEATLIASSDLKFTPTLKWVKITYEEQI